MKINLSNEKIKLINLNKINYYLSIKTISCKTYNNFYNIIKIYKDYQIKILNNLLKFEIKMKLPIYSIINNHCKEPNFIILSSGQSNMGGFSSIYDKYNPLDQPDENIFSFNIDNNQWEVADLNNYSLGQKKYCKMIGNNSIPFQFAKNLKLKYPNIIPGIINVCDGAETIALWAYFNKNEKYYDEYLRTLSYRNCVKKDKGNGGDVFTRLVKTYNNAFANLANKYAKIDVVLWHQGESDYVENSNLNYYEKAFLKVINQFTDLNENNLTPIISGTLLENKKFKYKNRPFNDIIRNKNNNFLYNYAELSDLKSDKEGFHFITESTRKAGKLYFEAYEELMSKIISEGLEIIEN